MEGNYRDSPAYVERKNEHCIPRSREERVLESGRERHRSQRMEGADVIKKVLDGGCFELCLRGGGKKQCSK